MGAVCRVYLIGSLGIVDIHDLILCAMQKKNLTPVASDRLIGIYTDYISHIAAAQFHRPAVDDSRYVLGIKLTYQWFFYHVYFS